MHREIVIGELSAVIYDSARYTGKIKRYIHKFGKIGKNCPPVLLAVTDDGKTWRLKINDDGDSVKMTERGIVNINKRG